MKFGFITHPIKKSGNDEVVDLTLMNQFELSKEDPKLTLRWQRKDGGDWQDPVILGGNIALHLGEQDARMRKAVMAAITDDDNLNDPDALLVRWVRDGQAFQVVYDPRFKKHVDVANLKGEGKEQWAPSGIESDISVLAKDEDDAKSRVRGEFMRVTSGDEVNETLIDAMGAWLKAKMPVKKISEGKLPTVHPDNVYCKRGHQRAALEKAKPTAKKEDKAKK